MAHGDFKDLPRRTASDRVLCRFFQCFIKFLIKSLLLRMQINLLGLILQVVLLKAKLFQTSN